VGDLFLCYRPARPLVHLLFKRRLSWLFSHIERRAASIRERSRVSRWREVRMWYAEQVKAHQISEQPL
jgi:hypothetical protein